MLNAYQNPMLQGASTSSANAGSAVSGAGANGVATGLNDLARFNPASTNNANANIAGGNAFVAGDNIPGQVQAGMTAAEQAAAYGLNPQIDQSAAASGNINSSRDAIEHGVLASNLAQDATQMGSNLTANAFNTGVNTTSNTNSNNNNAILAAFNALSTGGSGAVNAGTSANAGSIADQSGLFNIASSGASGQNNDPYQSLQNFFNIVGGTGYGSTSSGTSATQGQGTSSTTYNPSTLSQIGAYLNMAGSLF